MESDYQVPTSLTVVSGVFLAIGAVLMIVVTADIVWRRGWRTMMVIMEAEPPAKQSLHANLRQDTNLHHQRRLHAPCSLRVL